MIFFTIKLNPDKSLIPVSLSSSMVASSHLVVALRWLVKDKFTWKLFLLNNGQFAQALAFKCTGIYVFTHCSMLPLNSRKCWIWSHIWFKRPLLRVCPPEEIHFRTKRWKQSWTPRDNFFPPKTCAKITGRLVKISFWGPRITFVLFLDVLEIFRQCHPI